MAVGGWRPGSGRPKGSKNKIKRAFKEKALDPARQDPGVTPLDYMLAVMRDPTANRNRRDRMSTQAAPYLHARLSATELRGDAKAPLSLDLVINFIDPVRRQGKDVKKKVP